MSQTHANPGRPGSALPMIAVALMLITGGAACGCYSAYWFLKAQGEKNQFDRQVRAREQPGNREAEGLRMMVGAFSGIGPVGMDLAAVAAVLEMEKYAWKHLSFALLLVFGGFQLLRYARHSRSARAPVVPPVG